MSECCEEILIEQDFGSPGDDALTIPTIASLRALEERPNAVWLEGYYAPGDGGGGWFLPSDTQTYQDNGGTWIESAGGAWFRPAEEEVTVLKFGARGDDTTSDSEAFTAAAAWVNTCWEDGIPSSYIVHIPKPAVKYFLDERASAPGGIAAVIPSFSATGVSFSQENPIQVVGAGAASTVLRVSGNCSYAMAYATIAGTTNRDQNGGAIFKDFTIEGPKDYDVITRGLGIDNVTKPVIDNIWFQGFVGVPQSAADGPGGVGLHIRGYSRGGTFGARILNCRFGLVAFSVINGSAVTNWQTDIKDWCCRYGIWLDGNYQVAGKCNDTLVMMSRFENCTIGSIYNVGSGTETGTAFSSENTRTIGNEFFSQGERKMERGLVPGATSTTLVRLTDIGVQPSPYDIAGSLDGMYFACVIDPNGLFRETAAYITDLQIIGSERWVTLATPLTAIPVGGQSTYRVGFADAASRAAMIPVANQHAVLHGQPTYVWSFADYYEQINRIVYTPLARLKGVAIGTNENVDTGNWTMRMDGSFAADALALFPDIRGSDQIPYQVLAPSLTIWNSEAPTGAILTQTVKFNNTGDTLVTGSVVQQQTNSRSNVVDSVDYTTNAAVHYVVADISNRTFPDQGNCMVVMAGQANVLVDGTAVWGDYIMSKAGNVAQAVTSVGVTAEIIGKCLGRALESKSDPALGLMRMTVKGF